MIIGPTMYEDLGVAEDMHWSNIIAMSSPNSALPMNAVSNTNAYTMGPIVDPAGTVQAGWENVQLVPAAISVQIMFPAQVAGSGGFATIGRLHTLSKLQNNSRTWDTFANQFISYNSPRLCAGGKLALRGVTMSATPYNMNELADFTPVRAVADTTFTWGQGSSADFAGFCPMVVVNDLRDGELVGVLRYLVTIEWRVRFDPSNPAQAAHTTHAPATESMWAKAIAESERLGHGCEDIAERVADYGVEAAGVALAGVLLA
jgi:hypothetical protein